MSKSKFQMPNEGANKKVYDLSERTFLFSQNLLTFLQKIPQNNLNKNIIYQLSKSGTSIGANYSEADGAESQKDFEHKMGVCRKEAKETEYWLKLLETVGIEDLKSCKSLCKESSEFVLIFSSIISKSKKLS